MEEQLLLKGFKMMPVWANKQHIAWCQMREELVDEDDCEECDRNCGLDEYSTPEFRAWEECMFRGDGDC